MKNQLLRLRDYRGEIKFAADATVKDISEVQVMRTGAWNHPLYGPMVINQQVLADMVANFDNNVRRQQLPVDYFHNSDDKAAGWFQNLYTLNSPDGGLELWGKVKWTPPAQQMLANQEAKYFSADFYFEWTDPETGVSFNNVLNGGGLVNRPFIKDMEPVTELSEGNYQMKTVEQLNAEIKSLGEQHVEALKLKDTEIANLKGEKAALLKEKDAAEKEKKFADLCAKGKACAAQKEAYLAGDFEKFAELAVKLNVVENGAGGGTPTKVELSEDEKKICEKFGLSEEEYLKANPTNPTK